MESTPFLRFLIAGKLRRDFIVTIKGKTFLDILGGSLPYTAAGLAVWETGIGLVGRMGSDYPQEWIDKMSQRGFDCRGIRRISEPIDSRSFFAYPDADTCQTDNPLSHFSKIGLPLPKELLGYSKPDFSTESRTQPTPLTLRLNDIPPDYLDATSAHLCAMDYLSQNLLPSVIQKGQITTITLEPSPGYMNPNYWDDVHVLIKGLTAFLTSEDKLRAFFQGRSNDVWEMAEDLAASQCEIIVIKRGSRGQYLYDSTNHTRWMIPAYPAQVTDPTGAGDAFCGGFLAGYRKTYDSIEAALHGSISASLVIEGSGPLYAVNALAGLAQARLDSLRDMARKV